MIAYVVESASHEFRAMRCEWDGSGWAAVGDLVGSDLDPVEALRKLIEMEKEDS